MITIAELSRRVDELSAIHDAKRLLVSQIEADLCRAQDEADAAESAMMAANLEWETAVEREAEFRAAQADELERAEREYTDRRGNAEDAAYKRSVEG